MPMATFRHGDPIMVDHTPTAAVAAGDVVVTSGTVRICHRSIAANTLGALAATGGIYEVAANAAIGSDVKVYWDPAVSKVTATAGVLKVFGITVGTAAADGSLFDVRHAPSS